MSLLRRTNSTVTVYPEVEWFDTDGNRMTGPAKTGFSLRVMIQPMPQSGTSARRSEQDNEGFESEQSYRMRVLAGSPKLEQQARLDWNGEWWSIVGPPVQYRGSSRTAHTDYTIRRT